MSMKQICHKCNGTIQTGEVLIICSSCQEEIRKKEIEKYEELIKKIEGSLDLLNKWVKADIKFSQTLTYPALKGIHRFIKEFREQNNG